MESELSQARQLLQAGRLADAESLCRAALAVNPSDAQLLTALGTALLGLSRTSEARAAFERAVSLTPDHGPTHSSLATALCEEERSEEALAHAASAARLGVTNRSVELTRARALMQLDRHDEAERVLVPLVTVSPRDIQAQSLLAQLRHTRGDADFASEFREAASRPNAPDALCAAYADTIRRSGNLELSEILLRHSLSKSGPAPELLTVYGTILHESGRYAEAVEITRTVAIAQPDSAPAAENYVAALLSAGDARAALPTIERFRERAPDDQRWITYRADVARQRGEELFREWCDFERLVRVYELAPPRGYSTMEQLHEELRPTLERRHRHASHPLDHNVRHGTRTSRGLLAAPEAIFRAYFETLAEPIAAYQAEIGHDDGHPMLRRNLAPARLASCWSVRLRRGGFLMNHIHPQGWLSSACYVTVPAEVEDVSARSGWLKFGEPRIPMPGVTPAHFVQPKSGRLVLFPSYFWHGTTATRRDEPHLTIAFDAVPGMPS